MNTFIEEIGTVQGHSSFLRLACPWSLWALDDALLATQQATR
jgi:hypothetical protein